MLIDNAKAVDRCRTTGRALNKFKPELHHSFSEVYHGKFVKVYNCFKLAEVIRKEYETLHAGKNKKKYAIVERIIAWLLFNEKQLLTMKSLKGIVSERMLREIKDDLEQMDLIEVFQYFNYTDDEGIYRTIPTVIRSTFNLQNRLLSFKG